ncbi:MAG: CDP-diacylglycerol--glycerol-3-phosphate 3-phosphatidyltransferase [Rhodospirillales bacterium]|nr:CDP-diacylglycerol--glycerol-3-phosphate 3-phosphatidyltransferase [Rhodospirillales bacterium]
MATNLPNLLTFSRILAMLLVVGLMFMDPPLGNWLALAAYTYACATDFFDGYLARVLEQQSALGRFLDPIADKLLVSAVLLMIAATNAISGFALIPAIIILCREILVSGLREFLAETQVSVPVSNLAKWKTTLQMIALGFLIVNTAGPDFGPLTTTDIGVFGLWIAAMLTLFTGYDYLRAGLKHIIEADSQK